MYMIVEVSQYVAVASFLEAWIEIFPFDNYILTHRVASFLEAWIEIPNPLTSVLANVASPPSWRRGLKLWRILTDC